MKSKVIVCGGAGFVGFNLIPLLKKEYKQVVVIDKHENNSNYLQSLHSTIKCVISDLSVIDVVWSDEFKGADCVIQLNAQISSSSRDPFNRNNVVATKNILEVMKHSKVKYIVHVSSAAVKSVRLDDYAQTKKIGEESVTTSGISYSVLRPSLMYGLFDNKNVGWLINFMKKIPLFPIPGNGNYPRQPVFVEDFAKILLHLAKHKLKNKIYAINGDTINYIDMVKAIKKSRNLNSILVYLPLFIFIFLMRVYNGIFQKKDFTPDQVKSLTSGDVFEDFKWWNEFDIEKTSFKDGLRKVSTSKFKDVMLEK